MIEQKLKALLRRLFGLFAVTLALGIPMILFLGPILDEYPTFDGSIPTATALIAMGSMAFATLVILAILLFSIVPASVELVKAIRQARQEANGDLFP